MQITSQGTQFLIWIGVTMAGGSSALAFRRGWNGLRRRTRRKTPKGKGGVKARGTILALRRKAIRPDDQFEIELLLRVETGDRVPFLACPTVRLSTLQVPHFQPGKLLTIRYEPGLEPNVTIESVGYIETDQDALRQILKADLAEASRLNDVGLEASAIVTAFTASGLFSKSDNQAATLDLKVLAPGRPMFSAKARGVFDSHYLHRFQPGNRIVVRFDPYRPHLVAIDRAWAHGP